MKPARGTALRQHVVMVRFAKDSRPGPKLRDRALGDRVVEIRKLLRTDMSLSDIALEMAVHVQTLAKFIKRRNLCNIGERSHFISRQRSHAREEAAQ